MSCILPDITYILTNGFVCLCCQRIHLSIDVGEQTNDYQEIAAKDKLTDLQLRVRQLLDQAEQISKEQNYQRVCIRLTRLYISRSQGHMTPKLVSEIWRGTAVERWFLTGELSLSHA